MINPAYFRQASLAIAPPGIVIEGLRMSFEVRTAIQGDPGPSTITVTNLAEPTAREIQKDATARLSAGYRGYPIDQVYVGEIQEIEQEFEGRERLTTLTLEPASRQARAAVTIATSYLGAVSLRTIVGDIAGKLGLAVGPLDAVPELAVADYVHAGKAEDALTGLLRPRGVEWYEADGELLFRRRGLANAQIGFVLREDTGMIGSPALTENGFTARMRLSPLVRLNQRVYVESERLNATGKIISLEHRGDTWDGEWQTAFEAVAL